MKSRLYLMTLGMAALMGNDPYRSNRFDAPNFPDSPKLVSHRSGPLEHYAFDDGFECDAYSPEQADKKHRKWWMNVGRYLKDYKK